MESFVESKGKIIAEIMEGLQRLKPANVNVDRKQSIVSAVQDLSESDVVLVAGKGHEDYQILGTEKIAFDDREIVRLAFKV